MQTLPNRAGGSIDDLARLTLSEAASGVVGYKPSFGLISRFGMYTQSATLDHVGVLTRSVDDAGLLVACLASHDARDPGSLTDAAACSSFEGLA